MTMFSWNLFGTSIVLSLVSTGFGCGTLWNPDAIQLKSDEPASLSTPNYPGIYPTFQHCFWMVDAGDKYVVSFRIDGGFHVDLSPVSCEGDFVEIHDGPLLKSPEIGQYDCVDGLGPIGQSSGRYILVKFVSDGIDTQQTGFNLLLYRIRADHAVAEGAHINRPINIALGICVPVLIIIVVAIILLVRYFRSKKKNHHPHLSTATGGFWATVAHRFGTRAKSSNASSWASPPAASKTADVEHKNLSVRFDIPTAFSVSNDKTATDKNNDDNVLVSNMENEHDEPRVVVGKP